MSNRRKKMIFIIAALVLALGLAVFFIIRANLDNKVSFTVNDTLEDGQGKRATVILLGGQSNASGCSRDDCLKENVSREKYEEYEKGYDNVYINYFATGTNQSNGFVKCATKQGEAGGYFGPELGMAEKLSQEYPDQQFFIIKYAWGGSNLHRQWLSPSSIGKTGELYLNFVAFVEASINYLVSKNYDVKIEGMCWMQGESDSIAKGTAQDYAENLKNLIKDIRKEFSRYSQTGDSIAFADAYIANNPAFWVHYDIVNKAKQEVEKQSAYNVLVDTIENNLICTEEPKEQPDIPHYDSMSQIKLGHLFIEELSPFFDFDIQK